MTAQCGKRPLIERCYPVASRLTNSDWKIDIVATHVPAVESKRCSKSIGKTRSI